MSSFIKRLLKIFFGIKLTEKLIKYSKYSYFHFTGRFARYGIDSALAELLPHEKGFYVELGANDGALASNSYFFELRKKWHGILIEPAPNLFLECYARRGKKNKVYCNACVPFDYSDEFVRLKYMGAMTVSESLKNDLDVKDFMSRGEANVNVDETVFEFAALSATLSSLLDRSSAPQIVDFLSLDVEGAELEVLKGINFKKYTFKCMVIESREPIKIMNYLEGHGYFLYKKVSHHDYILCNREYFSETMVHGETQEAVQ